jgi:hemin uptake protein HemP
MNTSPNLETSREMPANLLPPALDSRQLFQNGQRQVEIVHGEYRYSLRLTRANKLILTK